MKAKIRTRYEALRKKYGLPQFGDVDSELEIESVEAGGFLLREIRKRIAEKISDSACLLERVLQPDTNLVDLYESRVFSEEEKSKLFELYKRLMVSDRKAAELSVLNEEKLDAAFLKLFLTEWKTLKPKIAEFTRRLSESWEKETEEGEQAGYMG